MATRAVICEDGSTACAGVVVVVEAQHRNGDDGA